MRGTLNNLTGRRAARVLTAASAAASFIALAPSGHGQSLQSWSLPEGEASTAPRAQGPVDPLDPSTRPSAEPSARPTTTTTPSPSATARATPSPRATPTPSPAPTRTSASATGTPATSASAVPTPQASESSSATSAPSAQPTASPAAPSSMAEDAADTGMPASPPPASDIPAVDKSSIPLETVASAGIPKAVWWLIAIGSFAGALAFAGFLLMRRRQTGTEDEFFASEPAEPDTETPSAPASSSQPAEQLAQAASSAAAQSSGPMTASARTTAPRAEVATLIPSPPPATANRPRASGELIFDPIHMRLSLVYATLKFRFTLKAATAIPPGYLYGDMFSAHASFSQTEQLSPPLEALPPLGRIPRMTSGQAVTMESEIQLPLSSIRAVHEGDASFFVPLVRIAMLTDTSSADDSDDLPHLEIGCVFTVGVPSRSGVLAPLRTDAGPQDFATLDVKEVTAARRTSFLPLDPARAAG